MKTTLPNIFALTVLLLAVSISNSARAQCECEDGLPPQLLKHTVTLDTTDAPSSSILFPRFDPAMGVLNCVQFDDTLSLVSTSNVTNEASTTVEYEFFLNISSRFTAPGFNSNESANRTYGPSFLAPYGEPGDRTSYGPDTLFRDNVNRTNSSNVVGYLGTGNVSIAYTVNGGLISTNGGLNYNFQIISRYWGKFGLTYFWCPNAVLASDIKNFNAVKNNQSIQLGWSAASNTKNTTYEIQVSKDGRKFATTAVTKGEDALPGAASQFAYQFNTDQAFTGQLFFRIRRTDASGKVSYSIVKSVSMGKQGSASFTSFPNPASDNISLQFGETLDGNYSIDVSNQVGQVILARDMKLAKTQKIDLNLGNRNAPGLYVIRVKNKSTGAMLSQKIMIRR